jgi:O-antigen ligase
VGAPPARRRWFVRGALFVALAGPVALAFFSGGFFTEPRLVAGIVTWLLVLGLAVAGRVPLPRSLPGRLAVGGLVLMTVWSAVSLAWAPLGGLAVQSVQRLVLYVGALVLAAGLVRSREALRAVEPALAGGAVIVIGYGLAGRLLPGIVHETASKQAHGRLEQPLTYWNAEGLVAAVGLVLCARLIGDRSRPAAVRALAAAAAPVLGAGVYLSYSRGAIAAAVAGLVMLVALAPSWTQLRGAALAVVAAVGAAVAGVVFHGVASYGSVLSGRERDGAIVLGILVLLAAAGAVVTLRRARAEARGGAPDARLPGANRLAAVGGAVIVLALAGLIAGGLREHGDQNRKLGATASASRLTSVSSNRYEYWRVAVRAFGEDPVKGLGAGGFAPYWLRERKIHETVQQPHSLELEMAAELGLVGLLSLGLFLAGVVLAAWRALGRDRAAAAGLAAASLTWLLHASIDWDWQLPAVTLPVLVMAGALLALAEEPPRARREPAGPADPQPARATVAAR